MSPALTSSVKQDWATPQYIVDIIRDEYNLDFDAAARADNSKLPVYISPERNTLVAHWPDYGTRAWLNPPYGRDTGKFLDAAVRAIDAGIEVVIALVAARVDTRWFHRALETADEVHFPLGRIPFIDANKGAPFPSAFIVWDRSGEEHEFPPFLHAWRAVAPFGCVPTQYPLTL